MNKLIVISVLLLIGCSPASPDESEITIGHANDPEFMPEKKADSDPLPLGLWKSEKYSYTYDFTDLSYENKNKSLEIDKFLNAELEGPIDAKEIEYKTLFIVRYRTGYTKPDGSQKGYWYKKNDTIYVRYRGYTVPESDGWINLNYKLDRGSLIDKDGIRWYRQEGK